MARAPPPAKAGTDNESCFCVQATRRGETKSKAAVRLNRTALIPFRVHPQPAIIPWLSDQSCLYGILSNVFALVFQTLIRPQYVIERFFLPDRA